MNGYSLTEPFVLGWLLIWLVFEILAGFAVTRMRRKQLARTLAWLLVSVSVIVADRLTAIEPGGVRMIAIIAALLWGMKAVVAVESQLSGRISLRFCAWLGFVILWPGMQPKAFASVPTSSLPGSGRLFQIGIRNGALGVALGGLAYWIWNRQFPTDDRIIQMWIATPLMLTSLSLSIHFGVFNLLAGFWRLLGANTYSLFRAPVLAKSLSEFWGKRWNLAFSEMTSLCVYRPLRDRFGIRVATAAAFAYSGLLHELAISLPVRAGYGRPSIYFIMQAIAMTIEGAWPAINQSVWRSRLWTTAWILIPIPILFHRPFLEGCVWPLFD